MTISELVLYLNTFPGDYKVLYYGEDGEIEVEYIYESKENKEAILLV